MRTTVQINKLAEFTREYLDEESNICVHQQQCYGINLSIEEVTDLQLDEKIFEETIFNSSFQSKILESNLSISVTSDNSSYRAPSFQPKKLIDYDELYPLVHTENIEFKRNYQETVTSYSYTCDSQIGYGIKGPLPRLIKLEESADLNEHVALIVTVFYEVIAEREPIRIVVIHFEHENPPLWLKSLFQL